MQLFIRVYRRVKGTTFSISTLYIISIIIGIYIPCNNNLPVKKSQMIRYRAKLGLLRDPFVYLDYYIYKLYLDPHTYVIMSGYLELFRPKLLEIYGIGHRDLQFIAQIR